MFCFLTPEYFLTVAPIQVSRGFPDELVAVSECRQPLNTGFKCKTKANRQKRRNIWACPPCEEVRGARRVSITPVKDWECPVCSQCQLLGHQEADP